MKSLAAGMIGLLLLFTHTLRAEEPSQSTPVITAARLEAYWPLAGDARDETVHQRHATVVGAVGWNETGPHGKPRSAARFNGQNACLEIASNKLPPLAEADFSFSAWVNCEDALGDVPGDILSQYDPVHRRGIQLTIKTQSSTTSQTSYRHLQFGIDDGRESEWIDCGRPGQALLAFAMATHQNQLYVGTCEPGVDQAGHVYQYVEGTKWKDCGSPDNSNAVTALAVYNGELFAGTGRYRVSGSALPDSENTRLGGRIFRYAGDKKWIPCGVLPDTIAIGGMVVYQGQLYASSFYAPAGFYRYDGNGGWISCGTPEGKRIVAMAVFDGGLFGTSYDNGHVYRYDGHSWTDLGQVGASTQTYSFASYQGKWHVANWPEGKVFRWLGDQQWKDLGQLGQEQEVMGMLVHNGRLLAGTLPLAEVYSLESDHSWKLSARLDQTPDVKYRRAWTMAEHDGRVYCSVLPSGKIYAYRAGNTVAQGIAFPTGWHHIVAMRKQGELQLYLDGKLVSRSSAAEQPLNLTSQAPFRIGFGQNDYFCGLLAEVRWYSGALTEAEIQELSQ